MATTLCAVLVLGASAASSVSAEPADRHSTAPSQPTTRPAVRKLGYFARRKVDRLEEKIDQLSRKGEYAKAVPLAEQVLDVHRRNLGPDAEDTRDAQRELNSIRFIAAAPETVQKELAKADRYEHELEAAVGTERIGQLEPRVDDVVEIRRRHLGPRHDWVADGLVMQGSFIADRYDFAKAEPILREARDIYRDARGPHHWHTIMVTALLSRLADAAGEPASAERYANETLALTERATPDARETFGFIAVNYLSDIYRSRGDSVRALALAERAREMTRSNPEFADEPAIEATHCQNIASILDDLGDLEGAERNYRQALELTRRRTDDSSVRDRVVDEATILNNYALLRATRGDMQSAERMAREAASLLRSRPGHHAQLALSLANLAGFLRTKGDLAGAEATHREALAMRTELLGPEHIDTAQSLNMLGMVLQDRGKLAEAAELFEHSLKIRRAKLGDRHPEVASTLNNLALVARRRDETARAVALFTEARDIFRELKTDPIQTALITHNLGLALLDASRLDEARACLDEALRIRRDRLGPGHVLVAATLSERATVAEREHRDDDAESLDLDALRIIEAQRAAILGAERERAGYSERLGLRSIGAKLAATQIRLGKPQDAFATLERSRCRALLDLLARSSRDILEVAAESGARDTESPLANALERERRLRIHQTRAEVTLGALPKDPALADDERRQRIEELRNVVEQARRRLADAEAETIALLRGVWPEADADAPDEIRSELAPDELLLCYVATNRSLSAVLVPPAGGDAVAACELIAGADALRRFEQQVEQARAAMSRPIESGEPEQRLEDALRAISNAIVPRDWRARLRCSKRIIVIPDGPLHALPFEALNWIDEPGQWLDAGPALVYSDSGTLYRHCRARTKRSPRVAAESALVLGNPAFSSPAQRGATTQLAELRRRGPDSVEAEISAMDQVRLYGDALTPLPGTEWEARHVARLLGGSPDADGARVALLLGEDASVTRLESEVAGRAIVHLATHGLTGSRDRPYDASLALTPPPEPTPDDFGFLTFEHLVRRWRGKLADCDLVVLSACETQRGVRSGDSVLALPWAFVFSGAPTVVASLWKVDDTATALLMHEFYVNRVRRGLPKAEALRAAKRALRDMTIEVIRARLADIGAPKDQTASRGLRRVATTAPHAGGLATRPYRHPYYWAAFVMVGSPD